MAPILRLIIIWSVTTPSNELSFNIIGVSTSGRVSLIGYKIILSFWDVYIKLSWLTSDICGW